MLALLLVLLSFVTPTVRPVEDQIRLIAAEEEAQFMKSGEYAQVEDLPDGKATLIRIQEEGYVWFYSIGFDGDTGKVNSYKVQAWKERDCNNGGRMSYFIKERDSLRYRCSTENGVANEDDAKVQ